MKNKDMLKRLIYELFRKTENLSVDNDLDENEINELKTKISLCISKFSEDEQKNILVELCDSKKLYDMDIDDIDIMVILNLGFEESVKWETFIKYIENKYEQLNTLEDEDENEYEYGMSSLESKWSIWLEENDNSEMWLNEIKERILRGNVSSNLFFVSKVWKLLTPMQQIKVIMALCKSNNMREIKMIYEYSNDTVKKYAIRLMMINKVELNEIISLFTNEEKPSMVQYILQLKLAENDNFDDIHSYLVMCPELIQYFELRYKDIESNEKLRVREKIEQETTLINEWKKVREDLQVKEIRRIIEQAEDCKTLFFKNVWKLLSLENQNLLIQELIEDSKIEVISYIWKYTDSNVKNSYFKEIIEKFKDNSCIMLICVDMQWEQHLKNENEQNLEYIFLQIKNDKDYKDNLDVISKFVQLLPNETKEKYINYIFELFNGDIAKIKKIFEGTEQQDVDFIMQRQDLIAKGIDIKISTNGVDEELLKKLEQLSSCYNIYLTITIKDITGLSLQQLDSLKLYAQIESIQFEALNIDILRSNYDEENYRKCLLEIHEITKDIDEMKLKGCNEYEIFGVLIRRIAKKISYDHSVNPDNIESDRPFNLTGGLLDGKCVCAGYAEIVRNIFAYCGIECIYVYGDDISLSGVPGHAWNQVKLGENWYNMDLTSDRENIINCQNPRYLLVDDESFIILKEYNVGAGCKVKECKHSLEQSKIYDILYNNRFFKDEMLNSIASNVNQGEIVQARDILASGLEELDRSGEVPSIEVK